jgi:hypothetical protein
MKYLHFFTKYFQNLDAFALGVSLSFAAKFAGAGKPCPTMGHGFGNHVSQQKGRCRQHPYKMVYCVFCKNVNFCLPNA